MLLVCGLTKILERLGLFSSISLVTRLLANTTQLAAKGNMQLGRSQIISLPFSHDIINQFILKKKKRTQEISLSPTQAHLLSPK